MKDQYFGDVNDYRKYGLLRCFSEADVPLGVCWMLTAGDSRSDGLRVDYLDQPRSFRHHDPALFDLLKEAVTGGRRSVRVVEESQLLRSARFESSLLGSSRAHRLSFFFKAASSLAGSDLIFFDPDNGLEVSSTPYGTRDSEKYLFWREVEAFWGGGGSLLIYQHFRRIARPLFIQQMVTELHRRTKAPHIAAISTSHVLFLLASQTAHAARLMAGLELVEHRWRGQLAVTRFSEL